MKNIVNKTFELFSELEHCNNDQQKWKIEEMDGIMREMSEDELNSVLSARMLNKICQMIEEKKMSMENAILLLKCIGYCTMLKRIRVYCFNDSLVNKRFKTLIVDEYKKKEKKNEKLLVDFCECYISLSIYFPSGLLSVCVPCLQKVAFQKEENEEAQNEVEMALMALSNVKNSEVKKELSLNEITDIIEYHQEHHNLTHLAYQSAWQFLIFRFNMERSLEEVIVNELHFVREAARELEELRECVDWKRREKKKGEKEMKEVLIIGRWLDVIVHFFLSCQLWNEEFFGLIGGIESAFQKAKGEHRGICKECISSFTNIERNRAVTIEDLLKGRAVDAVVKEFQTQTLNNEMTYECLTFLMRVLRRLKEEKDEMGEEKINTIKKKLFEKMEEEGHEDIAISFYEILHFFKRRYDNGLSLDISDYFVNVRENG
ncbi:uncharacterized protein MONOS_18541 [Monocercomonoides exilis]|uniref:uncharacterized protein n=1 Tax=Monocercomonoides exilis TaxID=2049356 RepID=UPI003559DCE8|nr:hypothetical protein MONOS_18541 [Monocercomonoides exilis]